MAKTPEFIRVAGHLYKLAVPVPEAQDEMYAKRTALYTQLIRALIGMYHAHGQVHEILGKMESSRVPANKGISRWEVDDIDHTLDGIFDGNALKDLVVSLTDEIDDSDRTRMFVQDALERRQR